MGRLGVDFVVGESSVVAVTIDEHDTLVELTTHLYRIDDAGRDFTDVADRDAIDRWFGTATAEGDLAEPSCMR